MPGSINKYFLWVAALTIAVSVLAVLAVRAVANRILHPSPKFEPLAFAPPIVDTPLCVIVAIVVFLKISSYPNAVKGWRYVATAVLVVSFVPDVLLATSRSMSGGRPEACALMIMHVVVSAICVMPADLHYVDGGYYDTFGIVSLIAWLREALIEKTTLMPALAFTTPSATEHRRHRQLSIL